MSTESQTATFLNKKEVADIPDPKFHPDHGKVPFTTALKLDYDQEQKMVQHALDRKEQMEQEQGRNLVTMSNSWFKTSTNLNMDRYTFMGRRSIWEMTYNNKLWWRKFVLGGIFRDSNLTAPFSRKIARQMTAQAVDYYFGSDPWYAADPIGGQEEDLAELLNEFSQFKSERSGLKSCMAKAIEGAYVRGESVVKTVWETDEQIYEQWANILVDDQNQPIMDAKGDYITDKDKFDEEMADEMNPQTGEPIPGSRQPTGRSILRKDMTTEQPMDMNYDYRLIKRRSTSFKGAKSDVVYWQDILIPETAAHVQRGGADIVVQLSDMTVIKLISLYQRRGLLQESASAEYAETQKMIEALRAVRGNSNDPKSALKQARSSIGENVGYVGGATSTEPVMEIAECYMTYDANEDGDSEEIVLVIDVKNRIPLFYDYLPNVTPDGQRPFDVVRVQPIEGRWYGIGAMEMFDKSQRAIDLLLNRWNFAQSGSGRVTAWKPSNTMEGDRNPNLPLNMGQTITLKEGKTLEETLAFVTLPEVKGEDLQRLLEYIGQLVVSESGTASANDSAAAGLDTTKTATGIKNIQTTNNVVGALYWGNLEPSLRDITRRNTVLEFANADPFDVLRLFAGDHHKMQVLLSEDVDDLTINVDILMTRARNAELLQNTLTAINSFQQYMNSPVPVQHRGQGLYRDVMRALQINDGVESITPLDEPFGDQPAQPPALPSPGAPQSGGRDPVSAPGGPPPPPASTAGAPSGNVQPVLPNKFFGMGKSGA
jgi:hypothetical protein